MKLHKSNIKKYTFTYDATVYLYIFETWIGFGYKKSEDGQSYVTVESYILQSIQFISGFLSVQIEDFDTSITRVLLSSSNQSLKC